MVLQFGNCFQYSKIIYILFFLKTKCTNIFIAWRFFCHFIKSVINSNLCFYLECRSKSAWFYMSESQLLLTKNPSVFLSFFLSLIFARLSCLAKPTELTPQPTNRICIRFGRRRRKSWIQSNPTGGRIDWWSIQGRK